MYYNIAFDIVTIILIGAIYFANLNLHDRLFRCSSSYRLSVILLAMSTIFDILAALTGGNVLCDSDLVNIIFETIYMCVGLYFLYVLYLAISEKLKFNVQRTRIVIFAIVTIYTFMLLINIPMRWMFDIVDGAYVCSIFFYIAYCIPVYVMLQTIFTLVINKNKMSHKEFIFMLAGMLCPIAAVIIQLFNDRLILIQFGLGITILIMLFVWETPNSYELETLVVNKRETCNEEEQKINMLNMVAYAKKVFLADSLVNAEEAVAKINDLALDIQKRNVSDKMNQLTMQIKDTNQEYIDNFKPNSKFSEE